MVEQETSKNSKSVQYVPTDKVSLNEYFCDKTFKNVLRASEDNVYPEHKIMNACDKTRISLKKKQGITPKVTELPVKLEENEPKTFKKHLKVLGKSNVIFNDEYVDSQPKPGSHVRYKTQIEKVYPQIQDKPPEFSDDYIPKTTTNKALSRKLNDTFNKNPIEILSKDQYEDYNSSQKAKVQVKTQRVAVYLSSDLFKSAVIRGDTTPGGDKITNIALMKMKNALDMKKDETSHKMKTFKCVQSSGKRVFYA